MYKSDFYKILDKFTVEF